MCENIQKKCSCALGYEKGAIKKTLENNIFTIFGNIQENSSIVMRYHGILSEYPDSRDFYLAYSFDTEEKDKEILLDKCINSPGLSYCCTIDLEKHTNIFFYFKDSNGNTEKNFDKSFSLNIPKDPISTIMQRYGFEENENLPVYTSPYNSKLSKIKNILNYIKCFFQNIQINRSRI